MCIQDELIESVLQQRADLIEVARASRLKLREAGARGWEEAVGDDGGELNRKPKRSGGKKLKIAEIKAELYRRTGQ